VSLYKFAAGDELTAEGES